MCVQPVSVKSVTVWVTRNEVALTSEVISKTTELNGPDDKTQIDSSTNQTNKTDEMEILTVDEDIVHEKEMPKTQTTHTTEDVEKSMENDDVLRKNIIINKQKSENEVCYAQDPTIYEYDEKYNTLTLYIWIRNKSLYSV
ncbi:uncharacterized protein LOC126555265 isoform X2 [Aphis gossypii]|uniref:uncharacterized protein LOC126555265 isoform X2 n=1 Tax=Aphis gossypii TaxID=80765 RepID=UPI00215919F2|nr:uncharacterized protein LOC126555265 isoform X2 [Aphis gossypii]